MGADWLAALEDRLAGSGEEALAETLVSLAFAAAATVEIPPDERRAASRRALLLLAAGGSPARGLDLNGRAVTTLAAELASSDRLESLADGLALLRGHASGLPHVSEALRGLAEAPDVAWRAYAAGVLAEELDLEIGNE